MLSRLYTSCSVIAVTLAMLPLPVGAAEWYVSVTGTAAGKGTKESPWDIESALGGRKEIAAGDTIWISGGTYKHPDRKLGSAGYVVRLAGQEGTPIHVRAATGEHVTIDGGLAVQPPATHVWIWDLEIVVSENLTMSRRVDGPGSHPQSYNRPWGGLSINKFKSAVNEDNLILAKDVPRPTDAPARVVLRPNRYDSNRANVVVFNWSKQPAVELPLDSFLQSGDRYRLHNPRDFYGKPIQTGRFDGRPVRVPVDGEFASFVLIRELAK